MLLPCIVALTLALPTNIVAGTTRLSGGWDAEAWGVCGASAAAEAERGALMPAGCTAGRQSRAVTCGMAAGGMACIGSQPEVVRTCGRGSACGYYASAWTTCDAACGDKGKQKRTATCVAPLLPGACKHPIPIALERECAGETDGCDWYRNAWSACTNTCGQGEQTRHVACLKAGGCREAKPPTRQTCQGLSCSWDFSAWTTCSRGCGQHGTQTRTKSCAIVGRCSGTPILSQSCVGAPCATLGPPPMSAYARFLLSTTSTSTSSRVVDVSGIVHRPTPGPSPAPIFMHSWFLGPWGECGGLCGSWKYRRREIHCQETCSVYRCARVDTIKCTQLFTTPHVIEDCKEMESCTTRKSPTTGPSRVTTTMTSMSASTTIAVSGGDGRSGGVLTSDPKDDPRYWECLVVLGQKVSDSKCVTGARAASLCGVGCPCCRRKVVALARNGDASAARSSPSSPEEGADVGMLIVFVIAAAASAGLVSGFGYAIWRVRKHYQKRLSRQRSSGSLSTVHQAKEALRKGSSKDVMGLYSATSRDPSKSSSARDAWRSPFDQPPNVNIDIGDFPRKQGSQKRNDRERRDNEDVSTSDSDHTDDEPFVSRRPTAAKPERGAREADLPAHGSKSEPRRPHTPQSSSRSHAGPPVSRSKTAPAPDGDSSREPPPLSRSKTTSQAAADTAFDDGLQAGKVGKAERQAAKQAERRKRRSASNHSGHPRGTSVPPRPRDTPADCPSTPPPSATRSTSEPPPSAPAPPPQDSPPSSSQNAAEARADDGVATAVNVHVLKLEADLDSTRAEDLESRKKNFKTLLLKWHPDKNTGGMGEAESTAQANEVFKHLLARRDSYLAE